MTRSVIAQETLKIAYIYIIIFTIKNKKLLDTNIQKEHFKAILVLGSK